MTKLFNKGGDGAGEIVRVLGLIDDDLDFTKWEPILPLGIREISITVKIMWTARNRTAWRKLCG